MATLIAIFLMVSIAATLVALPSASAHDPAWTIPTNSYITATPNPVGVGQTLTLVCWVDQNPPIAGGNQGPRWQGCTVEVTKPNGDKETIGPFTLRSATANDWVNYVPDQVGTYTFVFSWPGQTLTADQGIYQTGGIPYIGDFFAGSTSAPHTVVVQQEPIAQWQEPPLPTDYWQRPLNDANRAWSSLASNWLKGSWLVNNQQYGQAPDSPHVLWTMQITPGFRGGINDAAWPGQPTNINDYENSWTSPIVMNGIMYYNPPQIAIESGKASGYYAVDLQTGQQIWYKNGTDNGLNNPYTINTGLGSRTAWGSQVYMGLTQGQLYHYSSVNGQGMLAYLWMVSGSTWYLIDPATGNWLMTLKNVPGGTAVTDQDGSLLRYTYNKNTGNLLCWNSSQAIPPSAPFGTGQQQWKLRYGATVDAVNDTTWTKMGVLPNLVGDYDESDILPRSGYTMNLTVQKGLPGDISILQDDNRVPKMIVGKWIDNTAGAGLGATYSGGASDTGSGDYFTVWAMSIDEHAAQYSPFPNKTSTQNTNLGFGTTLLWNKNITVPLPGKNYTWSIGGFDYDAKVFIVDCSQLMQHWGYSLETGDLLWGPTAPEGPMNYYGMGQNTYYGKYMLSTGYEGTLYCYDPQTGDLLWNYNATSVGSESPYGSNYPLSISGVCDGKVFLHSTEHSPTKPLWRGSYLRCLNITDGTEMWKFLDFNMGLAIADGKIITGNAYDDLVYCIGKGPSKTTVEAPMSDIVVGRSAVISGTVTDQSPGAMGTPAIADENMQAWMEYLYEQQAKPTNATGVPVSIDAIDPNGNYVHLGDATSDTTGNFGLAWTTPNVPGKYTIIASFAGSKSYGSSIAETYAVVSDAPTSSSPQPTQGAAADPTFTIIGVGIAMIIAVAIATVLILRKRP